MRGFAAELLSDPRAWITLLAAAAIGLVAARLLIRHSGWAPLPALGAVLSTALVAALTLSPGPGQPVDGPTLGAVADCARTLADPAGWVRALVATQDRGERVGNVLMFVPVCGFAVLATGRWRLVGVAGVLAPVMIELSQSLIDGGRDCAANDWVNNATGALLGAAAGAALLWWSRRRARTGRPAPFQLRNRGGAGPGPASTGYASAGDPPPPPAHPPAPAATPPHAAPPDGSHDRNRGTGRS